MTEEELKSEIFSFLRFREAIHSKQVEWARDQFIQTGKHPFWDYAPDEEIYQAWMDAKAQDGNEQKNS